MPVILDVPAYVETFPPQTPYYAYPASDEIAHDTQTITPEGERVISSLVAPYPSLETFGNYASATPGGLNNWWYALSGRSQNWSGICYGAGVYVATARSGVIAYSYTGIENSWVEVSGLPSNSWMSVCYGDGQFIAVANSGSERMAISTNGVNWRVVAVGDNLAMRKIVYGNGTYVAVSTTASTPNNIICSTNGGASWSSVGPSTAVSWEDVAYGNGYFVAVSNYGTIATSTDGRSWGISLTGNRLYQAVTYGAGKFLAISTDGYVSSSSNPAVTWGTRANAIPVASWRAVTYGMGRFIAVSPTSASRIAYSDNGETWVSALGGNGQYVAVTTGPNMFIALSENPSAADIVFSTALPNVDSALTTQINAQEADVAAGKYFVTLNSAGLPEVRVGTRT